MASTTIQRVSFDYGYSISKIKSTIRTPSKLLQKLSRNTKNDDKLRPSFLNQPFLMDLKPTPPQTASPYVEKCQNDSNNYNDKICSVLVEVSCVKTSNLSEKPPAPSKNATKTNQIQHGNINGHYCKNTTDNKQNVGMINKLSGQEPPLLLALSAPKKICSAKDGNNNETQFPSVKELGTNSQLHKTKLPKEITRKQRLKQQLLKNKLQRLFGSSPSNSSKQIARRKEKRHKALQDKLERLFGSSPSHTSERKAKTKEEKRKALQDKLLRLFG